MSEQNEHEQSEKMIDENEPEELYEEGQGDAQEEEYQDEEYEYEGSDMNLERNLSKDQPYSIYNLNDLVRKIWEEIEQKAMVCAMSPGWTLMLYYFTDFNSNYFDDLIDQEQTGRNIIKYSQNYEIRPEMGECPVCLSEDHLINNACGHRFCKECWKFHITLNHTDRNVYELFPLCQQEGCYTRTNFHLMQSLWEEDFSMKEKFEKLLCLKYSLKSIRVKICPNQLCGKAIYMNSVVDSTVTCECLTELCRHCGHSSHWPLQCVDLKNWQNMVNDKENQWINKLVTQKCPMCKENIEKNEGCIHMTCVCKYEFCWICMKIWRGHTSYAECSSVKKDDFQQKLKQEQKKKSLDESYYNQRFEEAKSDAERLFFSLRRVEKGDLRGLIKRLEGVKVLKIHTDHLSEWRNFINKSIDLIRRCTIYNFFEREQFKDLKRLILRLSKATKELDDFIFDDLPRQFKKSDEQITKGLKSAQEQKVRLKNFFLSAKQKLNAKSRQGVKVIEFIREGAYIQALKQVCSSNSSLYIDEQPSQSPSKKQ